MTGRLGRGSQLWRQSASASRCSAAPAGAVVILLLTALGAAAGRSARSQESAPREERQVATESLRAGRGLQERARTMARELVASVIEGQLRQLRENGMDSLPIHAEILAMQKNIDLLVRDEMRGVVDLLLEAESQDGETRLANLGRIRAAVRSIILRLSEERQVLLRRLKVADIAAQVRRLIDLESAAADRTLRVAGEPEGRREALTLAVIEDQRIVGSLFPKLVATLLDVRGWEGTVATGATRGLAILDREGTAPALINAENRLSVSSFTEAVAEQRKVIGGLKKLLDEIEATQGLLGTEAEASVAAARELAAKAETLAKDIAAAAPEDEAAVEGLIERQSELAEQIAELGQDVRGMPAAEPAVAEALARAEAAVEQLFEGDTRQAAAETDTVAAQLAEAADALSRPTASRPDAISAEDFGKRLAELARAQAAVAEATTSQQAAAEAVRTDPAASAA